MTTKQADLTDEKLPIKKLLPLGLQHVLAMYAGAIAVPIIMGGAIGLTPQQIAYLVAADLFTCGIATLIQSFGFGKHIGIKLPVIMGCSFVSVAPMIIIGKANGLPVIYGAIICAGVFVISISFFFGKILKFFPSLVTGTVILIVGLSLVSAFYLGGLNSIPAFLIKTLALLLVMSMLQVLLTRLRIDQTVGLWWRFGAILVLAQLLVMILLKGFAL